MGSVARKIRYHHGRHDNVRVSSGPETRPLDLCKRIYGYLSKMRHMQIRINTAEPDFSDLVTPVYDWQNTVYRDSSEEIPHDIPEPLGKFVTLRTYVDVNLYHDILLGR